MKRQAEPKDMLTKRYQQFQRRLARHYLNLADGTATTTASGAGSGHGGSADVGPPRQVLGGRYVITARARACLNIIYQ